MQVFIVVAGDELEAKQPSPVVQDASGKAGAFMRLHLDIGLGAVAEFHAQVQNDAPVADGGFVEDGIEHLDENDGRGRPEDGVEQGA